MEIQRFEEFVMIAECKSMKNAAQKLGISASTLSSRINLFEKALGTALFERTPSALVLTDAGQRFYYDAEKITMNYKNLKKNLQSFDNFTEYDHIRIGVTGTGLPFYLGPFLDILNRRQPNIKLDLLNETQVSIQEGLTEDLADFYIAPIMEQIVYHDINRLPLYGAQQYITLPVSHPLASRNSVLLKELDHETFLLHPKCAENCIRDFQLQNLKASNIHYSIYETASSDSLYRLLVPIGKGLLFLPAQPVNLLPNCTSLPLEGIRYPAPSSLFYKKNNLRPEVRQFINEFINFVKEQSSHEHGKNI